MAFEIGQPVDPTAWATMFGKRGLWARDADPQWYIFTTAPQGELPAEAWLRRNGVPECWFPTEMKWRIIPRGKRRKVPYMAPIAPRYLFSVLDKVPHWDVLFDRARGKLTGVVSRDGVPQPIPEAAMMQMQQVPQRLETLREDMRRARQIGPGDRATVQDGPMAGWTVDVTRIHAGIAHIVIPLLGQREVPIEEARLRKLGQ